MRLIRIGAAALNQTPLAWEHNRENIARVVDQARTAGVSVLCLPELCITGYGCEDAFLAPDVQHTASEVLLELVPRTKGIAVALGLPVFLRSGIFSTTAFVVDGRIAGFAAKRYLPSDGLHYEPRWFRAWPAGAVDELELGGQRYPLGDLLFDCAGVRIGFEICEDAWVALRPGLQLARRGADVVLNPSASHFSFGKHEVRKRFVLEGSRTLGVAYAFANLLGNEAGRAIYDGDAMVANGGRLMAETARFSFTDASLTHAVVDIDRGRQKRAQAGDLLPELGAPAPGLVPCAFQWPALAPDPQRAFDAAAATFPASKEEEFSRAVALGLFDYLRKSRSRGFVVSLSGGADSAACASSVAIMCELAAAELGVDGAAQRLGLDASQPSTARDLVGALLTTVYQSTANSSAATRGAAREVAEGLGARHLELDVDDLVTGYVRRVEAALGRELGWERDDLALQNVQARTRAPGVWLIANLQGALLLATNNRSEAAVGYTTMDGDTCGGLSPIAGIDKTFLRAWLRWVEREGPSAASPIPSLAAVNALPPTAELRPGDAQQTDETDLMPYEVLDAMQRAAIRDKQSPLEVFRRMCARFPAHGDDRMAEWTERFFRLWARNQWKRERFAPSFHLDDENLDPKTWCRFPILSGGFEREISALRDR